MMLELEESEVHILYLLLSKALIDSDDRWTEQEIEDLYFKVDELRMELSIKYCDVNIVEQDRQREKLSQAYKVMAKRELEELKRQSDEAFLMRSAMDRKLTSI